MGLCSTVPGFAEDAALGTLRFEQSNEAFAENGGLVYRIGNGEDSQDIPIRFINYNSDNVYFNANGRRFHERLIWR